jgi:hypothetical protein
VLKHLAALTTLDGTPVSWLVNLSVGNMAGLTEEQLLWKDER